MSEPTYPRPAIRALVSVLVALHVFAVFLGPFALPPSSDLAAGSFRLFQPYVQGAFLDTGYRFFAPEPGPSHLVRYELIGPDDKPIVRTFPDRNLDRPRLLYHRHFMLSEFLNTTREMSERRGNREILDALARSYARHLAKRYDAKEVTLYLQQHELPFIRDVQQGMLLTDPSLYAADPNEKEIKFGPYRGDELRRDEP